MMKKIILVVIIFLCISLSSSCDKAIDDVENTSTPSAEGTQLPEKEVVTLSCFINHPWYTVDKFEGIIAEEITERTGIKLDLTVSVDSKQLGVFIASGSLPDMVYTNQLLDRLSNPEICYSYDELIEQYNIPWEIDNISRRNSLIYSSDDQIYMVLNHLDSQEDWDKSKAVPMLPSMSIRQDILDDLGNPKLDTLDDLMDIYAMVKKNYPGMIPLTFDVTWRFECFRVWTGVTLLNFIEQEDGSYKHYINTENYYNMLKMLNEMFQKGYMISDNFAAVSSEAGNLYKTNQAFSHSLCTQNGNIGLQRSLAEIDPSFLSVEVKPLGESDYVTSDIGWSGTFISRNCSDPEAAIKYMQFMFSHEGQMLTQCGREGIDYVLDDKGLPKFSQDWIDSIKDGSHDLKYNPWLYFGGSEIVESESRCAALDYQYYEQTYSLLKKGFRNEPWIMAALPTEGDEEKLIYDSLDNMIENFEAKVIMSGTDEQFEESFIEYMETAETIGIAKLEDYMSSAIPIMRKAYRGD